LDDELQLRIGEMQVIVFVFDDIVWMESNIEHVDFGGFRTVD